MSHGIENELRDFVLANSDERDWHKLTRKQIGLNPAIHFPKVEARPLHYMGVDGASRWSGSHQLIALDDDLPCGGAFNLETFGFILPQKAWESVQSALSGSRYSVERIGMLKNRSFWFVSLHLDELQAVAPIGHKYQLNFSGGLDGQTSPQGELNDIRAVCWNTISLSRASGRKLFQVKQTKFSRTKLITAEQEIESAVGMARLFNIQMETLGNQPVTTEKAREVYAGEIVNAGGDLRERALKSGEVTRGRAGNTVETLVELFSRGDGNKGESRLDVLNGFTQLFTRGDGDSKKDTWQAVSSSEFGGNANRKAQFLATLASNDGFETLAEIGRNALAMAN